MQLLCLLAENIYLTVQSLILEYILFKMFMVRVKLNYIFYNIFIRIKLVKEIIFFVNAVAKPANRDTMIIVKSLAVHVLTVLVKTYN